MASPMAFMNLSAGQGTRKSAGVGLLSLATGGLMRSGRAGVKVDSTRHPKVRPSNRSSATISDDSQ